MFLHQPLLYAYGILSSLICAVFRPCSFTSICFAGCTELTLSPWNLRSQTLFLVWVEAPVWWCALGVSSLPPPHSWSLSHREGEWKGVKGRLDAWEIPWILYLIRCRCTLCFQSVLRLRRGERMAHTARAHVPCLSAMIMVAITTSCITWLLVSKVSAYSVLLGFQCHAGCSHNYLKPLIHDLGSSDRFHFQKESLGQTVSLC